MKKLLLVAALLAAGSAANAAVLTASLDSFLAGRAGNPAGEWNLNPFGTPSNATWTYDTDTGDLQATGNFTPGVDPFGAFFWLFAHSMNDVTISGGVATSTSYTCLNGPFAAAPNVGSQVCGGYDLNTNGDESTITWSNLGRDVSVVLGGDDSNDPDNDAQTIRFMDVSVVSNTIVGGVGTLILETDDFFSFENGVCSVNMVPTGDCDSAGTQMTFSVVPVPAAVWLFGSALGLLGWVRRRATA